MEEDKLFNELQKLGSELQKLGSELQKLSKEVRDLRRQSSREGSENKLMSLIFFLVPFGAAITLYSANILNQALDFKAPIWYGYAGVATGIFCMVTPLLLPSAMSNKKRHD